MTKEDTVVSHTERRYPMSTMLVTSEDLSGFAMQIKASQSEVQSVFEQLRSRMQYAAGVWQSPASSSLQEQFASLSPVFDSYIQVLENYVQYLNQTAAAYAENEEMLRSMSAAG